MKLQLLQDLVAYHHRSELLLSSLTSSDLNFQLNGGLKLHTESTNLLHQFRNLIYRGTDIAHFKTCHWHGLQVYPTDPKILTLGWSESC